MQRRPRRSPARFNAYRKILPLGCAYCGAESLNDLRVLANTYLLIQYILMKNRVTLTMDPEIAGKAKKIAHARRTSVSALVEDLIRQTPVSPKLEQDFVAKWAGRLRLRKPSAADPRFEYLKKRYGIADE